MGISDIWFGMNHSQLASSYNLNSFTSNENQVDHPTNIFFTSNVKDSLTTKIRDADNQEEHQTHHNRE
jgi:hypothetical protein